MPCPDQLIQLFKQWSGDFPQTIVPLPRSGSARQYFRLSLPGTSAVGVYHADKSENNAFLQFASHFHQQGLPVPLVYLTDPGQQAYLQQDLGDQILFDFLMQEKDPGTGDSRPFLREALTQLSLFQVLGHQGLDYSAAYPRKAFDGQSMRWDLNYFKYHFLKFTGIVFDEQELENDFSRLIQWLRKAPRAFFLYRDFQSRNLMIHQDKVWFIDFQGGRKGYPAYDVASLLFDAKANLSPDTRDELLDHYLSGLPVKSGIHPAEFRQYFPGFVLIRKLQAMGAFGFRGIFERKTHFLQSIPFALRNARWVVDHLDFKPRLDELSRIFRVLSDSPFLANIEEEISKLEP